MFRCSDNERLFVLDSKASMKTLLIVICVALAVAGCKKGAVKPRQSNATLIGYDQRMCPTPGCGGLVVTLKNDTAKNPPPFYLINETLEQLGLGNGTDPKFPIAVNLSYRPDTGLFGTYHYIIVTHIALAN